MKAIIFNQENIELIKKGLYEDVETVDIPEKESHFKKHGMKYVYGLGLVAACGLCYYAGTQKSAKYEVNNSNNQSNKAVLNINPTNIQNITQSNNTTIIEGGRKGHAGNIIYCPEADKLYNSQGEAERDLNLSRGTVNRIIKGVKKSTKDGLTFKKIGDYNNDNPEVSSSQK